MPPLTKRWLVIGAVVLVAAGLALGLSLVFTGGGGAPKAMTHDDYRKLWSETHVGDRQQDVLARWPEPYQHYVDNLKDECYEWSDRVPGQQPLELYNMCFRNGVLHLKTNF